ncbi:hypothetical protein [Kitasatospora sp. NPDC057198]|uniref:hypothetical protein n=1 Tax=Kitasatospora sp. NPDC057198 TaxID=3346046 RepID=UPI0036276B7F
MKFGRLKQHGATATTPVGELTVRRDAPSTGLMAVLPGSNTTERWYFELDGRPLADLPRFGFGDAYFRPMVHRSGVGTFEGAELRIDGNRRMRAAERFVRLSTGGRTVRFRGRGALSAELVEEGRVLGRAREGWELAEPDPLRVLAVAVFHWARLDSYLDSPLDLLLP